jgi:hypothetical protein
MEETPPYGRVASLIALVLLSTLTGSVVLVGTAAAQEDTEEGTVTVAEEEIRQERGDVATMTLELNGTEQAFVSIGSEDVGYHVVARVTDGGDGTVSLTLNTFYAQQNPRTAGVGLTERSRADGDGLRIREVRRPESPLDAPLPRGSYPVSVGAVLNEATGLPDEQDESVVRVTGRSTRDARTMTAPGTGDLEFDTREEFLEVVGDPDEFARGLTPTDRIAEGDWLVVQFNVSGIYGAVRTRNDLTGVGPVGNATGISVTVIEENTGDDPPRRVDLTDRDNALLTDDANNTMYLVLDTEEGEIAPGVYRARFELNETNPLLRAGAAPQTASSVFVVTERQASFGGLEDGNLTLEAREGVPVSGTTTLAPGSELTVQLRRTDGEQFLLADTTTVRPDRTFRATFNLSGSSVGANVTAVVADRDGAISENTTVDVVPPTNGSDVTATPTETAAPATPTETAAPATPTEPTATQTPMDRPASPGGTTTTGQPGFTPLLVVVALLLFSLRTRRSG